MVEKYKHYSIIILKIETVFEEIIPVWLKKKKRNSIHSRVQIVLFPFLTTIPQSPSLEKL